MGSVSERGVVRGSAGEAECSVTNERSRAGASD
jgi:hypothetical protein